MANLQDIANKSGVSMGAVSRILNNDVSFNVTPSTKKKVLDVARELGYKGGSKYQKRSEHRELHIGVVQMYSYQSLMEDPYYFRIENNIELYKTKYHISLTKIEHNGHACFVNNSGKALDGIFAIGIFSEEEIKGMEELSEHIVFIDSSPDDQKYYSVVPNFQMGVEESIRHFIEKGHTKIGFIGEEFILGNREGGKVEPRRIYFENAMRPLGLYRENYIIEAKTNVSGGYESTKKFLNTCEDRPTAFFVSSDSCVNGVMRGAIEAGLRIPEDISIISFNNTILSECAMVPLTSIAVRVDQMAITAIKHMIELITEEGFPVKTAISCHLVDRNSVNVEK